MLTDNGVQFVQHGRKVEDRFVLHIFGAVCAEKGIEHRLTKPYYSWTNGQAERIVRTIKDATIRAFHYATIDDLRRHTHNWLLAYNHAKQLKALRFRTSLEALERIRAQKPELFIRPPSHDMRDFTTRLWR